MVELANDSQPFGIGRAVSDTFSTLLMNLSPFLGLTFLVYAPVVLVYCWIMPSLVNSSDEVGLIVGVVTGALVFIVLNVFVAAFVAEATFSVRAGRRHSVMHYVSRVLPRMPVIILALILQILIISGGMLLLIVPGILALVILFVTIPACMVERLGPVVALKRSRTLTKGYRWPVFGFYLVLIVINVPIAVVSEFGMESVNSALGLTDLAALGMGAGQILSNFFYALFGGVATAIVYKRLRELKDGLGTEQLASIFD